ncbi:hypothetical protein FQN54_007014 [Arachnomyces sp. PD_36]|nr:hypothetical protein FQN54_007014 [Arachnomyces sp. PD_36]
MRRCDNRYENCSGWSYWGRWVVLAVIIALAFLGFFLWACYSSRRRRRMGLHPLRGTGWAGRNVQPLPQYQQQYYDPNGGTYPPPPQYQGPSPAYMNQNPSYYGGQQQGVELQQPQNAYHGGQNVYAPPPGPPPAK